MTRNRIARLEIDGRIDQTLNPTINGSIQATAMQADGKTLIGGNFSLFRRGAGQPRSPKHGTERSNSFQPVAEQHCQGNRGAGRWQDYSGRLFHNGSGDRPATASPGSIPRPVRWIRSTRME